MNLKFEWDEEKAVSNLKKHRVSFDEAKTVFGDPFTITIADPEHSIAEMRFIDIGTAANGKVLVVSYTERSGKIRIISCREARKREVKNYEDGKNF